MGLRTNVLCFFLASFIRVFSICVTSLVFFMLKNAKKVERLKIFSIQWKLWKDNPFLADCQCESIELLKAKIYHCEVLFRLHWFLRTKNTINIVYCVKYKPIIVGNYLKNYFLRNSKIMFWRRTLKYSSKNLLLYTYIPTVKTEVTALIIPD